jgi:hypothetical protein
LIVDPGLRAGWDAIAPFQERLRWKHNLSVAKHQWVLALQTGVAAAVVPGLVSAIITRLLMRVVTLIVNSASPGVRRPGAAVRVR